MNDICAGIVTYNPNINLLIKNINAISIQTKDLVIFDNGSQNFNLINDLKNRTDIRLSIINNGQNDGIARALNVICQYCYNRHFKWVLTLDQDSVIPENLLQELEKGINQDTAIVSPNIVYRNNEKYADYKTSGFHETEWTITSASLTNLSAWNKIGGFDEKLFIDGVDRDFCIRLRRAGYRILIDFDIRMLHELGNLKCRKVFNRTIYVTNHSAIRKYYMARNSVYLDRKLGTSRSFKYITSLLLKTLFYEDDKFDKIKSILKGIADGQKL